MQQTCSGLSRSFEHETFRALSNRANRKGIVFDGITVAARLTGRGPSYVREAVDTLLDADLIERLEPGTYLISDPCRCKAGEVFEVISHANLSIEQAFEERKGTIVRSGAQRAAAEPTRPKRWAQQQDSRGEDKSRELSRSLPKIMGPRKSPTVSTLLNRLTYQFLRRCNEEGISPRGWNAAGMRANLNRWNKEGLSLDLIEEMIDLFARTPHSRLGTRSVAWKLFVSQREELERRARLNLPPQPEEVSASIQRMRQGVEYFRQMAAV